MLPLRFPCARPAPTAIIQPLSSCAIVAGSMPLSSYPARPGATGTRRGYGLTKDAALTGAR